MRRLVLSFALLAACASPPPRPEPIVVASDLDNLPFAGVAAHVTPIGRDADMMEAIAARIGRPLRWLRMPFDALLPAIEAGEIDVVCATIGITPERAERVAFTVPYFTTSISAVVRAGDGEPRTLAELAGRRVHAGRGTTSERAVRAMLPAAELVLENKDGSSTVQRLHDGELDAAVMDEPAARRIVGESGGRLRLLPEPLAAERYALVVGKDAADLLAALDAALIAMRDEGELARLDDAYGLAWR